jgi:hypothetical protein
MRGPWGIFIVLIWLTLSIAEKKYDLNPEKLMIATVIDPTSHEVSRDAFTLLRSIRLFGGSLNNATILVCIALSKGESTDDYSAIIEELHALEVEVDFIDQPEAPKPKTLNKFSTFHKFDPLRFAYFLWLDADVLVFKDPVPYLSLHAKPGLIECAPEFYSYMRRYPELNETSVVWNNAVGELRTIGTRSFDPVALNTSL